MADRRANMLGTECNRLLTQNERAERNGSPDPQGQAPDATGSWHSHSAGRLRSGLEPIDHIGAASVADSSGFSLAEVAARVGFSDQSQFTHHFKRLVGVTPGQFRTPARSA